jgi:hypothetical protein
MMNIKRTIALVAVLLIAGSLAPSPLARAQDQGSTDASTAPRPPERRFGPGTPPPWGFRGRGGGWRPSDEDWNEISAFMKQYSPKRWEVYQKLPPDRQQSLQIIVARRYRLMQWVRNTDPELYEIQKTRWILGDEIFGLTQDLKAANSATEPGVRQKLKDKIGQFVDLGVQERKTRVARWEKNIANERELITRETRDREEIIRNRLRAAERDAGNLGDDDSEPATQDSGAAPAAITAPTTAPSK